MNILDKIVEQKRKEVDQRKLQTGTSDLKQRSLFKKESLSFKKFLSDGSKSGIIAEFKRKSPSKGIINQISSVADVTAAYARYGASAVSVLTDESFFGGSLQDLLEAATLEVPVLRKDFIIDEYQLFESKAYGADIILLIAACLSKEEVKHLSRVAKSLGLNVLLEVHNEEELSHMCDEVDVLGVNNRDLKDFTVDIGRSIELSKLIPADMPKISESGIDDVATIRLLKQHGFTGFLIGERFMRENDPCRAFELFVAGL